MTCNIREYGVPSNTVQRGGERNSRASGVAQTSREPVGMTGKELPSVDLHQIKTCCTEEIGLVLKTCQPSQELSDNKKHSRVFLHCLNSSECYNY